MLAHLMQALDELPFPTVALVQGAAYGGALALSAPATSCWPAKMPASASPR